MITDVWTDSIFSISLWHSILQINKQQAMSLIRIGPTKTVFLTILVIVYIILSINRNQLWHNEIRIWEDAITKSPLKLRTNFNLARAYHKLGNLKKAEKLYTQTLHLFPTIPDIYNNLGNIYNDLGQIDKAIELYIYGLEKGETAELHFNLAVALEKKGEISAALNHYRRVLILNPDDSQARASILELSKKYP